MVGGLTLIIPFLIKVEIIETFNNFHNVFSFTRGVITMKKIIFSIITIILACFLVVGCEQVVVEERTVQNNQGEVNQGTIETNEQNSGSNFNNQENGAIINNRACFENTDCVNMCSGCYHVLDKPGIDCAGLSVGNCLCVDGKCTKFVDYNYE